MKRVLLTGATGFIGRHCVPSLARRGYEVHAVFRRVDVQGQSPAGSVHWHQADLLRRDQVFELMAEVSPTHLLHLAWYAVPGKYWTSLENFRWVQAGLDLFEAFASAGGRRIVVAGSCAEYEWGADEPCSENRTPLKPATLYGTSKHALRIMLDAFAAQEELSAAWGRIFFLYGPHEHPSRLVASVINSLLRGEPALCSHGRQVRDLLYVKDVAEAFVALLGSEVEGAVNIASGRARVLRDVIYEVADMLNRRDLVKLGAVATPSGEPAVLAADVSRLTDEVGWRPERDMADGLEETIAWWKERIQQG
ncbi:MAG: NAD-dependent epimerase/dehydratase [Acidobacteriota bacterium]|nr:NAD-dependent epimerase/dehydratase [Acidobacteriota bacterium]